ncbi:hypothetical protein PG996_004942 [Apiospora saccharicola]|uniref:Uncharacterized protein n=1 Tax=Apiospora saccharicola TaxID=335842 RepID=A0ABR1VK36_9PEZI
MMGNWGQSAYLQEHAARESVEDLDGGGVVEVLQDGIVEVGAGTLQVLGIAVLDHLAAVGRRIISSGGRRGGDGREK